MKAKFQPEVSAWNAKQEMADDPRQRPELELVIQEFEADIEPETIDWDYLWWPKIDFSYAA